MAVASDWILIATSLTISILQAFMPYLGLLVVHFRNYATHCHPGPILPTFIANAPSVLLSMLHVAVHPCVVKHFWILLHCEIPTKWLTVTVRNVRALRRTAEYVKSKNPVK